MKTADLLALWSQHPKLETLHSHSSLGLKNALGSSIAMLIAGSFESSISKNPLIVLSNRDEALYLYTDLVNLLGESKVLLLPGSYNKGISGSQSEDSHWVKQRTETISQFGKNKGQVVISYHDAIYEKVASLRTINKYVYDVNKGDELDVEFLIELLESCSFQQEEFVYEPGSFAVRGGIIDVFSFAHENPVRIVLDGNKVESIRFFDANSQLSLSERQFIKLTPNIKDKELFKTYQPIFDFFDPEQTSIWIKDFDLMKSNLSQYWRDQKEREESDQEEEMIISSQQLSGQVNRFNRVVWGFSSLPEQVLELQTQTQSIFNKNFDLALSDLKSWNDKGYQLMVFAENPKQIDRLYQIVEDTNTQIKFEPIYHGLSQGFIDHDLKVAFYSDHELFGRYFKFKEKRKYSKNSALTLKELQTLQPGDYVVHIDHGIGKFGGMHKEEINGKIREVVRLVYQNNDLLIVPINSLHKIAKFTGKEGKAPAVHKLGSGKWEKQKQSTKKKVKDIARELIALYAKRKAEPGFAFQEDSYLQTELEASFIYEDTPDQAKATEDVKQDMESAHPMDRLVCGDVGFGKTEVAIRAAHKAVCDSKQVAVLVPTTILAHQHYRTFRSRLEGFPVTVDYINRFKSQKEQRQTLQKVAEGKVDILIGTHRLVGKDVKFRDLGLLVIDEEQKFGVAVKDKLKELRVNVDTLTLTATPIPRTLHFSLMGARDLSVINTPPPNRQPVETKLHTFDMDVIKEAIQYEVSRGGQAFVVHHRIRDIYELAEKISDAALVNVAVAHGQMEGSELEKVMVQFMEGEYDVLVATSIIESGLDIPNANTIIINNAHMFGLSDLHQMRGRVGRSNRKAYCHLISPPLTSLTDDAKRRLRTLEEYAELGSGFQVAMRDLDIRGAGNLLGGEQSGFISEIGFDMYHKILDEAIKELRDEEFDGVLDQQKGIESKDTIVDTDYDLVIPNRYVKNVPERLNLYTQLSKIETEQGLKVFKDNLEDRFGKLPEVFKVLLETVRLKWLGQALGLEQIKIRKNTMKLYYPKDPSAYIYQSEEFGKVLQFVMSKPQQFAMKQNSEQLILTVNHISDIYEALGFLNEIKQSMNPLVLSEDKL